MAPLKEQVAKIAEDLIKLEINLILKPSITAQKMPQPRHALMDIGKEYCAKLVEIGCNTNRLDEPPLGEHLGSFEAFHELREAANEKIKELEEKTKRDDVELSDREHQNLYMLYRIKDTSDQIKGIFNAIVGRKTQPPQDEDLLKNRLTREGIEKKRCPLPLNPDELVLIRKIWEVGIEEIAMQTVIQLDGDVVTRIQPGYAEKEYAILHQLHHDGVRTALTFWKNLIEVMKDFLENIVGMFFKW